MEPRVALVLVIAFTSVGCETGAKRTPSASAQVPPRGPTLPEQARQLALASRPGEMHARLAPLVGDWEVSVAEVSSGGGEGATFHGRASLSWVLGGRFLRWEASVDFGGISGTTSGYLGFDPRSLQYQLMMISDLATGMGVAHGTGKLSGSGIVFVLEQFDPATGASLRARSRLSMVAEDHFTLEQLGEDDKAARIWHYRRAPGPTR